MIGGEEIWVFFFEVGFMFFVDVVVFYVEVVFFCGMFFFGMVFYNVQVWQILLDISDFKYGVFYVDLILSMGVGIFFSFCMQDMYCYLFEELSFWYDDNGCG